MEQTTDLNELLSQGMGPRLHWFPGDVSPARLAAVFVGMANGDGGVILIGISPRSTHIQGIGNLAEILDIVFQAALLADPSLVLPLPQALPVGSTRVLQVLIPAGLPHVYNLDGRYLGREGVQTNPLPARRLRELLLERGIVHFETQTPPGAILDDLDAEKVEVYIRALDLPGEESWQTVLDRRGCLGKDLCPTYAALAMFGREPQRWLPSAMILAARFIGPSFSDQYVKLEIRGTLPEQIRQAELFVRQNLAQTVQLTGLTHEERHGYPLEAVRELLVNAVAHRDYNLQGDMIHLNIFSDRLEVHSPGYLPGPVNLDNLLEARFSRNAVIVQTLADLGFIERLGYGLDRVVRVMRQNNLAPPRFEEVAGAFRATLYAAPQPAPGESHRHQPAYRELNLNTRQESALDYLGSYHRITNREYQELCPDVHAETLRRDLSDLVRLGLLIKIGDKKSTYYVLKK